MVALSAPLFSLSGGGWVRGMGWGWGGVGVGVGVDVVGGDTGVGVWGNYLVPLLRLEIIGFFLTS